MAAGYHPPLKQELDALPVLRDAWKRKADLATAPAAPLSREMDALQKQRAQVRASRRPAAQTVGIAVVNAGSAALCCRCLCGMACTRSSAALGD